MRMYATLVLAAILAAGPGAMPSSSTGTSSELQSLGPRLLAMHAPALVASAQSVLSLPSGSMIAAHVAYSPLTKAAVGGEVDAAYARQAVVMPPDGEPISGSAAITEWLQQAFERVHVLEALVSIDSDNVTRIGALATLTGRFEAVLADNEAPDSRLHLETKFMVVLVRSGASWRVARQTWGVARPLDGWRLTSR